MIAHHFVAFTYATEAHPATTLTAARSVLDFIGGSLLYITAPIVLIAFAAQPNAATIRDTLRPADPGRRILVVAFAAPFLFAALIAVLLQVAIAPLWAISAMTLLPVVMLSSPLVTISRPATVLLMVLAIIFPLVMVAISPVVAIVIHHERAPNYGSDYKLVAKALESAWHRYTDKQLKVVASIGDLVNGIDFYFVDQPSTLDILNPTQTPWIDADRIGRGGVAIVCPEAEVYCLRASSYYLAYYPTSGTEDVVIARRYVSTHDTPVRYKIVIVPPRATHPEYQELPHQTQ